MNEQQNTRQAGQRDDVGRGVDGVCELKDRRPLVSRSTRWAQWMAGKLAATNMTPNQISFMSMVAAAFALCSLAASTAVQSQVLVGVLFVLAAIGCQLRLLCNLMDGMVAIEAGKQTRDGAVWNELPDRVADILILAGLGIAADAVALGWAVAVLAVSVAYVRELGKGIDGIVDFSGPMAKPHRMALVSGVLLFAAVLAWVPAVAASTVSVVLQLSLWVLCIGCLLTLYRRTRALLNRLQERAD